MHPDELLPSRDQFSERTAACQCNIDLDVIGQRCLVMNRPIATAQCAQANPTFGVTQQVWIWRCDAIPLESSNTMQRGRGGHEPSLVLAVGQYDASWRLRDDPTYSRLQLRAKAGGTVIVRIQKHKDGTVRTRLFAGQDNHSAQLLLAVQEAVPVNANGALYPNTLPDTRHQRHTAQQNGQCLNFAIAFDDWDDDAGHCISAKRSA